MIQLLIVDSQKDERELLEKYAHMQVFNYTDDRCVYNVFSDCIQAERFLEKTDSIDIAMIEIVNDASKHFAAKLRKEYKGILLVVIANNSSIADCVIPEIFMNSVLVRPSSDVIINKTLSKCFEWFCMNNYHSSDSTYSFKGKDGRMMIEYSKITHFESREKRILLCTDNEEYYFYDTIDNLANVLPQEFVRCHRSFIVNVERIKKIRISDNCIFLDNGFIIPLSRSYKNKFKGRFTY